MAEHRLARRFYSQHSFWQRGHLLIGCGVLLVVAAQIWPDLPSIAAMALIGRGAVLMLQSKPRTIRQDSLVLVNLVVYCVLVCLAIVAQSNTVLQDSTANVRLSMLLDHALAIVLLGGLACSVFSQFSRSSSS